MVIRITSGRLRAGTWSDFERTYRENVNDGETVKGLRGRLLAQDSGDMDAGFAMSLWDHMAEVESCEQSELFKELTGLFERFFVGEHKTYRCEVKHTDMVS
jgi:heme-degrading monooxygenase HmoA